MIGKSSVIAMSYDAGLYGSTGTQSLYVCLKVGMSKLSECDLDLWDLTTFQML